ncbi:MAG: cobyric acid synthase CobQ [Myxococcales bacterium]|nr:cobyric acid synthase CobQ [Myxococcales bacterium]
MPARAVMVLGTTSGAGKSWLATALCRWYARFGLKVAPFKAQNMSNNARVVPGPDGRLGEIGSAQYFQALAARARPEVRMNPVLLKPERDTSSQVVVMGQVRAELAAVPWRERSERLWPFARDALRALLNENELVVIEGAGSPAEINLHASDYVNMRTAREAEAACLVVADIDRGGAFAHLFGTHQLLPVEERALVRGFVLNKFRGDPALLAPGPAQLAALTGVPTLAVLPLWRDHGLPEEDGVLDEGRAIEAGVRIAVVAFPHLSNLDEFQPLRACPGVSLRWARTPAQLADVDWIILPGSKNTAGDRAWMRAVGLDAAIGAHAADGRRVLGLCGGLQMLGGRMMDPHGVEGNERGLDLLPVETRFERDKLLSHTRARFAAVAGPWRALADVAFEGYEIRHGRSDLVEGADAAIALRNEAGAAIGWQRGSVLGLYAHGLFEAPAVMRALFGVEPRTLDEVFDGLADFIDGRFAPGALSRLAGLG